MASGRSSRNNILAGLFVLITLSLGVFIVILVSNLWDRLGDKSTYLVSFTLLDGAEGLDEGSVVKVGGKQVGHVTETRFVFDESTNEPLGLEVEIAIDANVRLYEDADVQLQRPLLGTSSSINISPLPMYRPDGIVPPGPPRLLNEGGRLYGRLGAPGFLSPGDYAKIQGIIAQVDRIVGDVEPRIGPIMDDAQASAANIRAITADARTRWDGWATGADSIVKRIEEGSQRIPAIIESVEQGTQQGRDFIASAQQVIDVNRPKIDEAIESVREFTRKVQGEAYDKFIAALDSGRQGLDSFASAAARADELITTKSPELEETITAAMLAAQQLKLVTIEVRAAPWRLLYQPTKKELENELLYNSVRAYSETVTQLRAASEALRVTAERAAAPGGERIDQATIDGLTQRLKTAFEQYQQAEKAFMDRWVADGK
jgi:ABC-type transporter Mla subunit MlaD